MASKVGLFGSPLLRPCNSHRTKPHTDECYYHHLVRFQIPRLQYSLRASRRFSNYSPEGDILVSDPRKWGGGGGNNVVGDYDDDGGTDDEDDEEDEDRSLDLLVKFIQNVFRKISRRARKAVRSVLPISISTKLVGFSVNGVIILAFLWVLKAFLEVVCTLGSVVFVSILLIRGIWSGISYLQENRYNHNASNIDNDNSAWSGAQPAT